MQAYGRKVWRLGEFVGALRVFCVLCAVHGMCDLPIAHAASAVLEVHVCLR